MNIDPPSTSFGPDTPGAPDALMLLAYADGELAPDDVVRVDAALARDPSLARSIEAHRALRIRVSTAFAGVLDEPIPAPLQAAVQPAAVDNVRPLRARATRPMRWSSREWLAMAASLAVGAALGLLLMLPRQHGGAPALVDNAMIARPALAQALDRRLTADHREAIRVGLSFRAADGRFCRVFQSQSVHALAGLACRTGDGWQVTTLAPMRREPDGQLRQAATALPPSVLADIDARIEGPSLDATAERAARARGWR